MYERNKVILVILSAIMCNGSKSVVLVFLFYSVLVNSLSFNDSSLTLGVTTNGQSLLNHLIISLTFFSNF